MEDYLSTAYAPPASVVTLKVSSWFSNREALTQSQ